MIVRHYGGCRCVLPLSRWLEKREKDLLQLYSPDVGSPAGLVTRITNDSNCFRIKPVTRSRPVANYALLQRPSHERAYVQRSFATAASEHAMAAFGTDRIMERVSTLIEQTVEERRPAKRSFFQCALAGR